MALGQALKLVYLFRPSGYANGASMFPYRVTPKHGYMNISRNSNTPMLLTPCCNALMMVYIKIRNGFMPFTNLNSRMILNVQAPRSRSVPGRRAR